MQDLLQYEHFLHLIFEGDCFKKVPYRTHFKICIFFIPDSSGEASHNELSKNCIDL